MKSESGFSFAMASQPFKGVKNSATNFLSEFFQSKKMIFVK